MIQSVCIYCGSSAGNDPVFEKVGYEIGQALAQNNMRLVYGGAKVGIMGAVARGCLDKGGQVLGVIPKFLAEREITNHEATEVVVVESMHERKRIMAENADAFIALPGGMGTLEEITEILTWTQLGLIKAPIGLLNVNNYYESLLDMFRHMNDKGLLKDEHLGLLVHAPDTSELIMKIKEYYLDRTTSLAEVEMM